MTITNIKEAVIDALRIKKKAIFFTCNKGGTGKTTMTVSLASILRSDHFNPPGVDKPVVAVFSADPQNHGIQNFLGEFSNDATITLSLIDIDTQEGRDELLNILDEPKYAAADYLLFDFAANKVKAIQDVVGDADAFFQNFESAGFETIVINPLTSAVDTAISIRECVETYGQIPTYVTAINLLSIDKSRPDSVYHKEYKTVALKALVGHKHIEVDMPDIDEKFLKLCSDNNIGPFSDEVETSKLLPRALKIRWNINRKSMSDLVKIILQ